MANYQDMYWQVRAELPGVPLPLLALHYAEAARDFIARSLAWRYSVEDDLNLNAATDWPTITAGTHIPAGTYVVQPIKVKWNDGSDIPFQTRAQLDEIDSNWEADTGNEVKYWTIAGVGEFRVVPRLEENQTEVIRVRVAIAPISTATSIPDELANEFQTAFKHGTLARLMRIPGKDWTNLNTAASYAEMFEKDIVMAKSRAAADFGKPRRTVRYGGLGMGGSGRSTSDDYGR